MVDLVKASAADGMVLLYGMLSGLPTPFPGFELGMAPVRMRTYTIREAARRAERWRQAEAFVRSGLDAGTLEPVIDRTFELADIVEAHRHLESSVQFGKSAVTVAR